ncbi:Myt1-like protein [Aphelenchoides avenae]|nr:Myt1-like protein [Aphelenchus avenae]
MESLTPQHVRRRSSFLIRPNPRLIRSAPCRFSFGAKIEGASVVSFKVNSPSLSPMYSPKEGTSYFSQCFEVECSLGAGNFGEALAVKSRDDGCHYAVKRLREPYRSSGDRRQKMKEVEKHETLPPHSNILGFHMAWEEDNVLFIQTELCAGNLATVANSRRIILKAHLWNFMRDILKGLEHLHENGYVHMDVKPENVLVSADGVCKLCDFGLLFNMNKDSDSDPDDGDCRYMAPEILNESPTPAADIFSLGISFLEMAAQITLPKNGDVWRDMREGNIPKKTLSRLDAWHGLTDVVLRMMAPEPSDRPTAKELLRELEDF